MKYLTIICTLGFGSAAAAQSVDCNNQVTQLDMNECAAQAFDAADAELNRVYGIAVDFARQLDAETKGGIEEQLRTAQRAWITYRDAACASEASQFEGGSIMPLVFSGCLERVTLARTDDLYAFTANY
jgi:uncharacterized protein YecT (DUF1311 family)